MFSDFPLGLVAASNVPEPGWFQMALCGALCVASGLHERGDALDDSGFMPPLLTS